jgi:hypothetical protein
MRAPQFPATGNSPVGRTGARLPSRSTQTSKTPRYVGDPLICRRAAQWLACWAPNPKFCGSKPRFAMPNASATGICPRRGCAQQAIRRAQARPDILPRGKHDTKPVCPSSAHRRRRFPICVGPDRRARASGPRVPMAWGPKAGIPSRPPTPNPSRCRRVRATAIHDGQKHDHCQHDRRPHGRRDAGDGDRQRPWGRERTASGGFPRYRRFRRRRGAAWRGTARRGAARRGVAWRGAARRGARGGARRSAWRAARRDCGSNPREAFPDREKPGRPHFPRIIFGRPFANGDVTAKCHADCAAVIIIVSMRLPRRQPTVLPLCSCANWVIDSIQAWLAACKHEMDTLGIEPRASRMLSGCDTTTPCAPSSS